MRILLFFNVFFLLMLILQSCKIQVVTEKSEQGILFSKYQQFRKTKIKNGFYRLYHENGSLSMEMYYKNGKLHGEERSYHPNGQLQNIANSVMGSYEGPFKYWYATGTLYQEGNYINNNIEGDLKTYYPNGILKEIVFFSKSVENGPYTFYHQNAKLKEEGFFLNGPNLEGTIKQYNDEALLIRKKQCEQGVCKTVWELDSLPVDKD